MFIPSNPMIKCFLHFSGVLLLRQVKIFHLNLDLWVWTRVAIGCAGKIIYVQPGAAGKWDPGFWNLSHLLLSQLLCNLCYLILLQGKIVLVLGQFLLLIPLNPQKSSELNVLIFQASMGSTTDKGYIVSIYSLRYFLFVLFILVLSFYQDIGFALTCVTICP